MRTPRKPSKKLLKAQEFFRRSMKEFIESKGAIPTPDGFYDHALVTPIGCLRITVYENWIACRFDNVTAATVFTTRHCGGIACNPYSGKWNFHYHDDANTLSDLLLTRSFVACLERLLVYNPSAEERLEAAQLQANADARWVNRFVPIGPSLQPRLEKA